MNHFRSVFGEADGGVLDAEAELDISERKQKAFQSLFIATRSFGFPLIRQTTIWSKKVKTSQCTMFSEPK